MCSETPAARRESVIPDELVGCPDTQGDRAVKSELIPTITLAHFREIVLTGDDVSALVDGLTTGRVTWAQIPTVIEHLDGESAVDYLTA